MYRIVGDFFNRYYWLNIDRGVQRSTFWIVCFAPMFVQMFLWTWWRRKIMKRPASN